MKKIILLLLLIINSVIYSQNKPSYPTPKEGYKRVDLMLPKIENQEKYKIEIRFAQVLSIAECAEGSFDFKLSNLKEYFGIPPYRFPYYVLENSNSEILEGMQEDCKNKTKVNKKILSDTNMFIEYQSSYARPFYIPESWTLEYRVWKADEKFITLDK